MSDLVGNPKDRFSSVGAHMLMSDSLEWTESQIVQCHLTKSKLLGPRPLGSKEIDGLLVPPGKAYTLLTDHLITC